VISVNAFYLDLTFITLAMLVVGGMRSMYGAVAGVITLSALTEILRQFERGITIGSIQIVMPSGFQEALLGLVMLVTLVKFPRGVTGGKEFSLDPLLNLVRRRMPPRLPASSEAK